MSLSHATSAVPAADTPSHTLADLCALTGLSQRTVRYYVQMGLVDRPTGETRAARYGSHQLEQLLQVKKWSAAGLALDRIRELLQGEPPQVPQRAATTGQVEVRSHVQVADGVELVIAPQRAGLSPEQVRALVRGVMDVFSKLDN